MPTPTSILFIFAGPGGGGKSTICEEIIKRDHKTRLSVSSTTRAKRDDEIDGINYNFITKKDFEQRIGAGELIEYTFFNNNYYGTEKRVVEKAIADGVDLVFDIEVEGVQNLKGIFGEMVVTTFVFTPSWEELTRRLKVSGNRSDDEIQKRLEIAKREVEVLTSEGFSDYLLINDRLEDSIKAAQEIVNAERRKFKRLQHSIML